MATNTNPDVSYGLSQALILDAQRCIVAQRDPTTADKAPIGATWTNSVLATFWGLTRISGGVSVWVNLGNYNNATAINFGTAATNHVTTLGSNVGASSTVINTGTGAAEIGSNATDHPTNVGSATGTSTMTINAGTGGLRFNALGKVSVLALPTDTQASPTVTTVAMPNNMGAATFTGFTTAVAASEKFIITNANVTAASKILVSASNFGAPAAKMTVTRVEPKAGTFEVTVTNMDAADALDGDIVLTWWVLA